MVQIHQKALETAIKALVKHFFEIFISSILNFSYELSFDSHENLLMLFRICLEFKEVIHNFQNVNQSLSLTFCAVGSDLKDHKAESAEDLLTPPKFLLLFKALKRSHLEN